MDQSLNVEKDIDEGLKIGSTVNYSKKNLNGNIYA